MQSQATPAQQLLAQIWQFLEQQDVQRAVQACQLMNQRYPHDANGWYASSTLALQLGGNDHALKAIEQALGLEPGNRRWLLQKARCLQSAGAADEAVLLFHELAKTEHLDGAICSDLGLLASTLALYEPARVMFLRAIELDPDNARTHFNLATVLRFLGDIATARSHCNTAIELDPRNYDAWFLRSGLGKASADHNHVDALQATLASVGEDALGQAQLSYALAKEFEDMGEYPKSFDFLEKGAQARRSSFAYDIEDDLEFIHSIIEVYSREFMEGARKGAGAGHENNEPIFILGLPRTGTTLVERILGNHDDVFSAGELTHFTRLIAGQAQRLSQDQEISRADMVRLTARIDFAALGRAYLTSTRPATGHSLHFIDKFPQNSLNVGPIHLALPQAKIILLQRHPMDSCYAMYKQLFTDIYQFSYDLGEMGRYFIAHREITGHWQNILADKLHVVRYEDLVTDTETEVRKLLDYCSLPWQSQCLAFHENPQASTTASAGQVRQKLYSSSIGRWKAFEQQLEPLRIMLEDAGCLNY